MAFIKNKNDWVIPILVGLIIGLLVATKPIWFSVLQSNLRFLKTDSYADALEKVYPYTVSIYTNRAEQIPDSALTTDPYFSKYFENLGQQTSLGSGILIDTDGLVVTNAHVIRDADEIIVVTSSGEKSLVTQTFIDPASDIAVLKTALHASSAVIVNGLEKERVGDIVFTIGNPFGIGQSVSMGVISATGRQQPNLTSLTDFIQTDAAINPGNSGGALVNRQGEIIGMNTAIFSSSGGSQGIGFAIPINHVLKVSEELNSKGLVTRGYLGVDVSELSPSEQSNYNLDMTGLRIVSVQLGSPADLSGLIIGDIITSINDIQFSSRIEAARFISRLMPGESTSLALIRNNKILNLDIKISAHP